MSVALLPIGPGPMGLYGFTVLYEFACLGFMVVSLGFTMLGLGFEIQSRLSRL